MHTNSKITDYNYEKNMLAYFHLITTVDHVKSVKKLKM